MPISKIIISDSHEMIREGIVNRLSQDLEVEVVAEAEDGYTTLKYCRQFRPDILIMDLNLSRPSGTDTMARARKDHPNMKIVVLASNAGISNALLALSKGAVGFMPRQSRGADFVNAVRAAESGFSYLPIELLNDLVDARKNVNRNGNVYGLSARELEILEASLANESTKQIAQRLEISVRTVETHRNNIHRKTNCRKYEDLSHLVRSKTKPNPAAI